jgi:hypothetical protein
VVSLAPYGAVEDPSEDPEAMALHFWWARPARKDWSADGEQVLIADESELFAAQWSGIV